MNLKALLKMLSANGCGKVYIKELKRNNNTKNQFYLGSGFDVLNILPTQEILADSSDIGGRKKDTFKSKLNYYWLGDDGTKYLVPNAQLILYPRYPEVRLSGLVRGCDNAPSELLNDLIPGRLLFLGVSNQQEVIAYVTGPETELAREVSKLSFENPSLLKELTIVGDSVETDTQGQLLRELKRIYSAGWINSQRLNSDGTLLPCNSSNCGGYTLEAQLGITPNGYSKPDYLGWELKQFSVSDFQKFGTKPITLMTPEPTSGIYVNKGLERFLEEYGYADKKGREARINFGGRFFINKKEKNTGLELVLSGYDVESGKIVDNTGSILLLDSKDNIAASWSFASLLKHWNIKHAKACYIPSKNQKITDDVFTKQYSFGNFVTLGIKTDFAFFLRELVAGNICYDPGIKLELEIPGVRKQQSKRRSQFRISANKIQNLYYRSEIIDLTSV